MPFDALPNVLDPDEGFVVTANQAVIDPETNDYPYFITDDWDRGYRSQRIRDLLERNDELSVADMLELQLDDRNPMAPTLTPYLLEVDLPGGYYSAGQRLLRDWDFRQQADSSAAAYYNVVWRDLLELTFHDQLPEDLWPDGGQRWYAVVERLLETPGDRWWDDVDTDDVVEARDDILEQAMRLARDELTSKQSPNSDEWELGRAAPARARVEHAGRLGDRDGRAAVQPDGWEAARRRLRRQRDVAGTRPRATTSPRAPSMRMVDLARRPRRLPMGQPHRRLRAPVQRPLHRPDRPVGRGRDAPWPFSRGAVEAADDDTLTLVPAGRRASLSDTDRAVWHRGRGDGAVVRLDRHVDADLAVVQQGAGERADRHPAQRTVVGAAAAAEPHAGGRNGERRHQDHSAVATASTPSAGPVGSSSPSRAGTSPASPVCTAQSRSPSGSSRGSSTRLPASARAVSRAPVPGSLPIETYAATVAARRTSGAASSTSARSRAASPISTRLIRLRAVTSWSRSAQSSRRTPNSDSVGTRAPHEPTIGRMGSGASKGLIQARDKMVAAGVDEVAIETFAHYYRLLEHGETGMIPESTIDPVDMESLADVEVPDDAAAEAIRHTVVIKLNGGLGTSMGMDRAKSLLCVRRGLSFLDIIARQVLHLRKEYDAPLPMIFMNSFRTSSDTLEAVARYDELPVEGLPLEFLQNKEPKLLLKDLTPAAYPKDPDLEWCPPGHGDLYTALRSTGLLDRLIELGYRHVFVSNSDNLGAVPEARVAGWFAASGAPFAIEAVRRTPSDRKGGHLARRKSDGRLVLRETAQTPPEDADVAGRPRPAPLHLHQQRVVRPGRHEAGARRAPGHPRPAADPQREAPRPRRQLDARGGPDRDRDGRRDRGVRGIAADRGRARSVRAGEDDQRPAGAALRRLRHRRRLRARPGRRRRPLRRSRRRLLQAGRRLRQAVPGGCAVDAQGQLPDRRGRLDVRSRRAGDR